ncbi:MAG: FmdB family zinc ribbon protein [Caldimonas sp.]
MPIYAYRCSSCGHAQDVLQRIADPVLTVCPACGQASYVKQVTAAGFQLKGSGWYVTDFRGDKKTGKAADAGEADKGDKGAAKDGDKAAEAGAAKGAEAPAPAPEARNGDAGKKSESAPAAAAPSPAPAAPATPAPSGKTGS